jgi:dolichol-phosphate mannosyltransferase
MVVGNLGVIGIYLGKVYDETKKRPVYVVARAINCEKIT